MVAQKMVQREDFWEWPLPFWKTCDAINSYPYIRVFTFSYLQYWPKIFLKKIPISIIYHLFLNFFCAIPLLFIQYKNYFSFFFFFKKLTFKLGQSCVGDGLHKKNPKTRIMIHKIAIRHVDKHNQPRGQTIYQINQRLSVALQRGVGEQLIACECAGWTLASQLTPATLS